MNDRKRVWIEKMRSDLVGSLRAASAGFAQAHGSHAVHDARKELKRAGSLARGFGQVVGADAYVALEAANAARRAYGRARDLDVLPQALDRVKCAPETRDALTRAIALERGAALGGVPDAEGLAAKLQSAATSAAAWDLSAADRASYVEMLRHTYKATKHRGAAAFSSGDADDLHELRTGVVDLDHQLEASRPAWPALIDALCEELSRLRQALGDFNDMTMLGEFALARRELDVAATEAFVEAVQRRRKPMERKAREQFERAFAERPGAFAKRMAALLAHPQNKP